MSSTDPDISASIYYNGIYNVPAQANSNKTLNLTIPFSQSNLQPYSPIPPFIPQLSALDSNGNILSNQYLPGITNATAAIGETGWEILVSVPIPQLVSNTAAIVLELTFILNLDANQYATSWILTPTYGVLLQEPTTALMQVPLVVDSIYEVLSSEVQSVSANINFPASNSSSVGTQGKSGSQIPQGSGQKRDITVNVPVQVTNGATTANNFLQANLVIALTFGGSFK